MDPKTVRKYVAPAEAEGIRPNDGLVLDRAGWTAKVTGWFPELVDARARSSTWPMLEARRELITKMLETNTVATVHQRLRDEHDLRVSVTSLRRYVWQAFPDRRRRAATPLRPLVPPGAEAQIDYGYLGRWLDPVGNRIRRVWAFVVVLALPHMFLRPVLSMDQSSWVAAHTAAWEFFGGTPRRLVTDNLKTGVIKADGMTPKLNRAYAEMADALRRPIDPARASKPKDKPRVERMMPYLRDSFWRGRSFASVTDMQIRAADWSLHVAGTRPHRSLDGAQPRVGVRVPSRPRRCCRCRRHRSSWPGVRRRWARTAMWVVDRVLYSVPWRHIGERVDARVTDTVVQVYARGDLIKTWPRATRGRCTDPADYPPEKVAFFMASWCGAAPRPRDSVSTSPSWWVGCWPTTRCTICAPRKGSSVSPNATEPTASTPPAAARWRWATRPTAR